MTSRPYDEQVKVWAAERFNHSLSDIDTVKMESIFDEGYACCGGTDPHCYCSFAESASMNLAVTVNFTTADTVTKSVLRGKSVTHKINLLYGNMNELIQEIYEAGQ